MCGFFLLLHNLILVYTRDECDTGLFEVNLMLAVNEADGEDLTVELSCLPVHSSGCVHLEEHKQKRPALLRGVWSGKRDSNYFSETPNNQHIMKARKDIRCKIGETFAAFQGVCAKDM